MDEQGSRIYPFTYRKITSELSDKNRITVLPKRAKCNSFSPLFRFKPFSEKAAIPSQRQFYEDREISKYPWGGKMWRGCNHPLFRQSDRRVHFPIQRRVRLSRKLRASILGSGTNQLRRRFGTVWYDHLFDYQ